ncbi:LuxR family transcriptional regulator [Sphingobium phenoxybenzoativorans]|uniref:LuxR family transcriptional regulator n=1 Tax=Sphingobium phenoxybenzoativorans TaxID=1592790 RepID=A0A975Q183_9SPHN|nr:LuxR family transcriptional regulator [Sphingobium phenoxybenzoativorans]QUT05143.1 LuxR family transcriptional regulator [Sphingobium phenoxybenzoativorans]
MDLYPLALELLLLIDAARTKEDLADAMAIVTPRLGFDYFAMTHHVDILAYEDDAAIHLHNYPAQWADFYASSALGVSDPVHRASHRTGIGFQWARIPHLIPLTVQDRRIFSLGREQGISDGFTVPSNIPGEMFGSCSFATIAGKAVPQERLLLAQIVGGFAFEAARRLWTGRGESFGERKAILTDRQRECVLWATRGKSDWEISQIVKISEETVSRHIRHACERYGISKRISLVGLTLEDGTLTITDINRRRYTPFWE